MATLGIDRPNKAFPDPKPADHIVYNPSWTQLRDFSSHMETTSECGSPTYVSTVTSRSADRTKNAIDDPFTRRDWTTIRDAIAYTNDSANELICVDYRVGDHPDALYHGRYFAPREYARIALALGNLFEPAHGRSPDFVTIQIPDHSDIKIRVLPDDGITCIVGSDYTGEAKKSFLRLFMYRVKQNGGLGLHAGAKRVLARRNGRITPVGQLFLGLSATGKTTLTCHDYNFHSPESTAMLQDDVCALLPTGTVAGSEGNGCYIKTIDLSPETHAPLFHAATQPDTVLENVAVKSNGHIAFSGDHHSTNARAAVRREHIPNATTNVNLDRVDQVFFITRNPLMPPIAKLAPAQAAAAFMLGESIETSAGDPTKAGEAVRVVGTNPFIIGSNGEEGNRFMDLLTTLDIESFILNTGDIGRDGPSIAVEDTVAIVSAVARDEIDWKADDQLGLTIPRRVPGIRIDEFYPPDRVADFDRRYQQLRADRTEYLATFSNLQEQIKQAAY